MKCYNSGINSAMQQLNTTEGDMTGATEGPPGARAQGLGVCVGRERIARSGWPHSDGLFTTQTRILAFSFKLISSKMH